MTPEKITKIRLAGFAGGLFRWYVDRAEELIRRAAPGIEILRVELDAGSGKSKDRKKNVAKLEALLLDGKADVAVHNARSLNPVRRKELVIAAALERGVVNDALICGEHLGFHDLPLGAKIGVNNLRRKAQLLRLRDDIKVVMTETNVIDRIESIDNGKLSGALFSWVDLRRMGLAWRVDDVFGVTELLPSPGQGIVALQTRAGEDGLIESLGHAGHAPALRRLVAEWAFLNRMEVEPSSPVAAYSSDYGQEGMRMVARAFSPDGAEMIEVERSTTVDEDPTELGRKTAEELISRGGKKIMAGK